MLAELQGLETIGENSSVDHVDPENGSWASVLLIGLAKGLDCHGEVNLALDGHMRYPIGLDLKGVPKSQPEGGWEWGFQGAHESALQEKEPVPQNSHIQRTSVAVLQQTPQSKKTSLLLLLFSLLFLYLGESEADSKSQETTQQSKTVQCF